MVTKAAMNYKLTIKTFLIAIVLFFAIIFIVDSCHTNPAFGQRRNLPELTPNSTQCESFTKEYSYNGHTIVRVDCSGNYWGFHSPDCPKCNK